MSLITQIKAFHIFKKFKNQMCCSYSMYILPKVLSTTFLATLGSARRNFTTSSCLSSSRMQEEFPVGLGTFGMSPEESAAAIKSAGSENVVSIARKGRRGPKNSRDVRGVASHLWSLPTFRSLHLRPATEDSPSRDNHKRLASEHLSPQTHPASTSPT